MKKLMVLMVVIGVASCAQAVGNLPDNLVLGSNRQADIYLWQVFENDAPGGMMPGDGSLDRNGYYGGQVPTYTGANEFKQLGDFDGDGLDDMILLWHRNDGGEAFWRYGARITEPDGTLGSGSPVESAGFDINIDVMKFGDLTGDGRVDLVATRYEHSSIEWLCRPTDAGGWGTGSIISATWGDVATDRGFLGDVNGDGVTDRLLERANGGGWEVFVDVSTAPGSWGDGGADFSWLGGDNSSDYMDVADINGDGLDDLMVVRNTGTVWELYGYYSTGSGFSSSPDFNWAGGDVNQVMPIFGQVEVPEPVSLALLGVGACAALRRRRH